MAMHDLRTRLAREIDPELRGQPGLSRLNTIVMAVICLSILLGILETEAGLVARMPLVFAASQLVFFVLFLAEYVLRLAVAPVNPRHRSALHYALKPASIFDLLVVLSFLLPFFGLEAAVLRLFRVARLVRLARLGRYSLAIQMILSAITARRYELGVSLVIATALMLLSSSLLYLAERDLQPEAFGSIPRAMWWSVATLTTVGYGDAVPLSASGRIAAAFTALTGIGLIALPTGILAGAFADALRGLRGDPRGGE
jgi:voltage-gated potassium channel